METVIMHPESKEQLSALKAFAKALNVKFETNKSPYSPDFLAKIKKSEKQVERGEFITLDPSKSLWENLG
jgi:predicted adenine nucleotide alpha hydrolase (AANH) superfamily ATPase